MDVMKILVTNDDGIKAPGIRHLVTWARKLGDVTVVAPKVEQSAKSHSIDIHNAFEFKESHEFDDLGIKSWTVDSTPADCVRVALCLVSKDFDLVLSGMNRGENVGDAVIYSATCGAALEAEYLGKKAIAFSTSSDFVDGAPAYYDMAWDFIEKQKLIEKCSVLNVNIPKDVKGIRMTRHGGSYFNDVFVEDKDAGNDMVRAKGIWVYENKHDLDVDTDAFTDGYISITPLTNDHTDWGAFNRIKA